VSDAVRVIVAEDDVLLREGISRILGEGGFEVVAQAGDAETLVRTALGHRPDLVVVDVRMPPGHGDDGLLAAIEIRRRLPDTGVLVLSQRFNDRYALELIRERAEGVGYLLKERVANVQSFLEAVGRVAAGGTALDPEVVSRLVGSAGGSGPLRELSARERDVLASMAEGQSNAGIADALALSQASVEKHITSIFDKLGLARGASGHRRVRAVLVYLHGTTRGVEPR
jgi:DNA-binding NarL/FixJ family response regulator